MNIYIKKVDFCLVATLTPITLYRVNKIAIIIKNNLTNDWKFFILEAAISAIFLDMQGASHVDFGWQLRGHGHHDGGPGPEDSASVHNMVVEASPY